MKPPAIKVEIIHIEGPLKGTIQEFFEPLIEIGRHPDCHVCFPKDMNTISRRHLDIRREGNRFMAIDHSTNGTLVNGKSITEVILKDGDVLTISENGPKISVLTTVLKENEMPQDQNQPQPETAAEPEVVEKQREPEEIIGSPPVDIIQERVSNHVQPNEKPPKAEDISIQKPLVIQFGAQIKSFQSLPVTIGSGPQADFKITHPEILASHAQISYHSSNYQIKDLTGRGVITVNGRQVSGEVPLAADTCLSLSPKGPSFQFLGDGRLAEIEIPADANRAQTTGEDAWGNDPEEEGEKKSFWPFTRK